MKNRLKLLIILAIVHFSFAQETANETHEYFEAGVGMGIRGGTTNRSGYAFRMKSGDAVEGKYKSPYLPAIPLLLLR